MIQLMQNLEKWLFYVFIFSIPFQTRIILVRQLAETPSRVGFNEWTAVFFYGTDILMVWLFIFWLIREIKNHRKIQIKFRSIKPHHLFLILFFVIATLSIAASDSRSLSVYQLIKLAEFIAFYFYIRSNFGKIFSKDRLLEVLVLSGFFQALIAISQYLAQGALGLKLLGESPITPGGAGVASFYVGNEVFLRAYGTFPHPNILATFLMIGIFSFYYLYFNRKFTSVSLLTGYLIYGTMLYAFFITYSRTVIGLTVMALIFFLTIRIWQNRGVGFLHDKRFYILAIVSLIIVLLFLGFNFQQVISRALISGSDEAVSLRIFYDKVAGRTTGDYPWLGVGIGAFVPKLMQTLRHIPAYYYQPVHNIYLLISAETGIFGIASFSAFLFLLIRNYIRSNSLKDANKLGLLLVGVVILTIGIFDHLLWTIQQGRIAFWLTVAFLSSNFS